MAIKERSVESIRPLQPRPCIAGCIPARSLAAPLSPFGTSPTGWQAATRRLACGGISPRCLGVVGMLISPAVAAHFTPASEGGGGAIALSIILGVGIALFLVYLGQKRWRRRKPRRDGNGE